MGMFVAQFSKSIASTSGNFLLRGDWFDIAIAALFSCRD